MFLIPFFLCVAFVHGVSAQNVFVNENGHLFEFIDKVVDVESPQTSMESDSSDFSAVSGNDAWLAVVIGSFVVTVVFILGLIIVYLCTLYVKVSFFFKQTRVTHFLIFFPLIFIRLDMVSPWFPNGLISKRSPP